MLRKIGVLALAFSCAACVGWADSIIVDGQAYTDISIKQSSRRYYVKLPSGETLSIDKNAIGEGEIVFGDGPLPERTPPPPPPEEPEPAPPAPVVVEEPEPAPPAPVVVEEPEPAPPAPVVVEEPEPAPPAPVVVEEPEPAPPAPVIVEEPEPVPPAPVVVEEPEPAPPAPVVVEEPEPAPPAPVVVEEPEPTPPAPVELPWPTPEAIPALPPQTPGSGPLRAGAARVAMDDGLEANALVLGNGSALLAFCTLDTAAFDRLLVDAVLAALEEKHSRIGYDSLMLSATGTYTAGLAGLSAGALQEALFVPFDGDAFDRAVAGAVRALLEAESAMGPAQVRAAEVEAPQYHAPRPGGSATVDSTLSVLSAESLDGKPMAYLINYAMTPLAAPGVVPSEGRGVPGYLAEAIRESAGGDAAVLFVNGAAGDIVPVPAADAAPEEQDRVLGEALARAALAASKNADARREGALACRAREVPLPPTLIRQGPCGTTVLHEARLDESMFLSMPALPAAQIGLLLRVGAMAAGGERVFLLGLTGDCTGFQPTIEEFFAVTEESALAFHGPLASKWYADHHLTLFPEAADMGPLWQQVPLLAQYAGAFGAAVKRGEAQREQLGAGWRKAEEGLETLALLLANGAGSGAIPADVPGRAAEPLRSGLALHLAGTSIRRDYAAFSDEDRVVLMGVAEGAGMPFDAVLLLQMLSEAEKLPEQARIVVEGFGIPGFDALDHAAP